ncbi:unnamed protein product, partial [Rotaria sp. Silwood2]
MAIGHFKAVTPPNFDSLYYQGCARLELDKRDEIFNAIENFNEALKLKIPQSKHEINIYYKRAFACALIGQYAEAIIDYTIYIQKDESNAHKGYLSRGLVYSEIKQYENALKDIQKANDLLKCSKYYTYCLAKAKAFLGQVVEAKKDFESLINTCASECQTPEKNFDTHYYYGLALYERQRYSAARKQFEEALKFPKNKQEVNALYYSGLTLNALGDIKGATEKLEEANKSNENHISSLIRLAMITSENDDLQSDALKYLNQAHNAAPHRMDVLYIRGELHRKMGQIGACIRDHQLALQLEEKETNSLAMRHDYE